MHANEIVVDNGSDAPAGSASTGCDLRDAVAASATQTAVNGCAAGSGDDDIVLLPAGAPQVQLSFGPLRFASTVRVLAGTAGKDIPISFESCPRTSCTCDATGACTGTQTDTLFASVAAGADVTVDGLDIDGFRGAFNVAADGRLSVVESALVNDAVSRISPIVNAGGLRVERSSFKQNASTPGVIVSNAATAELDVRDSVFDGNDGNIVIDARGLNATIATTLFSNNVATTAGPGAAPAQAIVRGAAGTEVVSCVFIGNDVQSQVVTGANVDSSTFADNTTLSSSAGAVGAGRVKSSIFFGSTHVSVGGGLTPIEDVGSGESRGGNVFGSKPPTFPLAPGDVVGAPGLGSAADLALVSLAGPSAALRVTVTLSTPTLVPGVSLGIGGSDCTRIDGQPVGSDILGTPRAHRHCDAGAFEIPTPGLTSITAEPAGANCAHGGQRVAAGNDNGPGPELLDGALEDDEVAQQFFVCTAVDQLVSVTSGAAGCPNGGSTLQIGDDVNADGVLDPSEVTSTQVICDGANGVDGQNGADGQNGTDGAGSFVIVADAGAACPNSGSELTTVHDLNDNGVLDDGEPTSSAVVCNGTDGTNGTSGSVLVVVSDPGDACANGGELLTFVTDENGNGAVDDGEPSTIAVVCDGAPGENGADGSDGADGFDSLTKIVRLPPGDACPTGGQLIETGLDDGAPSGTARDGVLEDGEVDQQASVCNGVSGLGEKDGNGASGGAPQGCASAGSDASALSLACALLLACHRRRRRR